MLHKKFWQLNFLSKQLIHAKLKVYHVLNYSKIFQVVHKHNPRTHSPQQNKKAALMAAVYFKVSTPVRLQRQQSSIVYLRLPKGVFPL